MSKKSNKKAQSMSLSSFLGTDFGSSSWADEVDSLPRAPAAAYEHQERPRPTHGQGQTNSSGATNTGHSHESGPSSRPAVPVPDRPPFTAYLGNLSFETTDRDIHNLFGDSIKVVSIRLPVNDEGTPRGFGYVEFEDRESLVAALQLSGETMLNRKVRIDVAGDSKPHRPASELDEKLGSNWRTAPRPQLPPPSEGFGGRGNRDGGFPPRGPRDGGFERRERDPGHSSTGAEPVGPWRRSGPLPASAGSEPPFRPRSILSRNAPAESNAAPSAEAGGATEASAEAPAEAPPAPRKRSVNPFGEAKPRDEAEIQRQFEERRKQREAEEAEERRVAAEKALAAKREAEEKRKAEAAEREAREKELLESRRAASVASVASAASGSSTSAPAAPKKSAQEPALPSEWRRKADAPPVEIKKPFGNRPPRSDRPASASQDKPHYNGERGPRSQNGAGSFKSGGFKSNGSQSAASAPTPTVLEKPKPIPKKNAFDVLENQEE